MTAPQERAILTREKVIAGAAEVFYRHGFGGATLSDITSAAGVTKGALYFHFPSKEDVALAIIEAEELSLRTAQMAVRQEDGKYEPQADDSHLQIGMEARRFSTRTLHGL